MVKVVNDAPQNLSNCYPDMSAFYTVQS
jgi:hypothetical protein